MRLLTISLDPWTYWKSCHGKLLIGSVLLSLVASLGARKVLPHLPPNSQSLKSMNLDYESFFHKLILYNIMIVLPSWSHSRSTRKDSTLLTNHVSIYGKIGTFLVSGNEVQRASNSFSSLPSHHSTGSQSSLWFIFCRIQPYKMPTLRNSPANKAQLIQTWSETMNRNGFK